MRSSRLKAALVSLILMVIAGCSSLPDSLRSTDEKVVTDYMTWINADPIEVNEVRLGGVIASITNLADRTRIEIVNLPISSSGKPDIKQNPNGRFVGYVDGFLEPLAYGEGQLITVVGQSHVPEMVSIGEFEQTIPVMKITGHHLWKIQERVVINEVRLSSYPCRSLHCRQASFGSREGRVIQEVK